MIVIYTRGANARLMRGKLTRLNADHELHPQGQFPNKRDLRITTGSLFRLYWMRLQMQSADVERFTQKAVLSNSLFRLQDGPTFYI